MTNVSNLRVRFLAMSLLACLTLCGCGGTYDSYVSGTVTLDGTPLPRGTVAFNPKSPGTPAYGLIESDGQYTIQTGREEGLPPGEYLVTVVANELPQISEDDEGPPPAGKPISPQWYRSRTSSGLDFTIEEGANEINLELTSEPPPDWNPPQKKKRRRR